MPQPTTAEVRLDEHKAASFGPAGPSILPFWLSTSRLRSNFVCRGPPQGRKIATNNFGIREMSARIVSISGRVAMDVPETRYAKSGDVRIAYQVTGSGPLDLVFVTGFVSNVDVWW